MTPWTPRHDTLGCGQLSQGEVRIPVSLEEFGHPKRRGNTLTTRSKTAPYKLATALVELKILGFDSMLNTLLHELGHALGLHAHLEDNGEMMTAHNGGWRDGEPCIGPTTTRALRWLYPSESARAMGEAVVCASCYFEGWYLPGVPRLNQVSKQQWGCCVPQFQAAKNLKPGRVQVPRAKTCRPARTRSTSQSTKRHKSKQTASDQDQKRTKRGLPRRNSCAPKMVTDKSAKTLNKGGCESLSDSFLPQLVRTSRRSSLVVTMS
eukprot:TRINITY_DN16009_c0_g2_i10.p1 TRINITY_DN16009_c0_g2~~TRINITY_DN16009_c0_g2_i10.p1  ORF type:complete len:264 (+),score=30.45 TRINITY_DN16009_c0_g2_i10:256-1047(+)